jgi:hypothetical protein
VRRRVAFSGRYVGEAESKAIRSGPSRFLGECPSSVSPTMLPLNSKSERPVRILAILELSSSAQTRRHRGRGTHIFREIIADQVHRADPETDRNHSIEATMDPAKPSLRRPPPALDVRADRRTGRLLAVATRDLLRQQPRPTVRKPRQRDRQWMGAEISRTNRRGRDTNSRADSNRRGQGTSLPNEGRGLISGVGHARSAPYECETIVSQDHALVRRG